MGCALKWQLGCARVTHACAGHSAWGSCLPYLHLSIFLVLWDVVHSSCHTRVGVSLRAVGAVDEHLRLHIRPQRAAGLHQAGRTGSISAHGPGRHAQRPGRLAMPGCKVAALQPLTAKHAASSVKVGLLQAQRHSLLYGALRSWSRMAG